MDEKEFAVIREIANNHQPSQRLIARKLGLSLGLTNLIIKRLVKKGYLKVSQLNARKLQYILTPHGIAEKTKKSYHYTLKTIKSIKNLKDKIQEIILNEYKNGKRKFVIQGNNELATLVEISLRNLNLEGLEYINADNNSLRSDNDFTILNSEENASDESNLNLNLNLNLVNIVRRLAELSLEERE